MPVIRGGGGGCAELTFDAVASRPMGTPVEPKVCEKCTRQFIRPVPTLRSVVVNGVTVQCGERFCPGCRARRKQMLAEVQ